MKVSDTRSNNGHSAIWTGLAVAFLLGLSAAASAEPAPQALIVANGAYQERPLAAVPGDADGVQSALEARGFQVTRIDDGNERRIQRAIRDASRGAADTGAPVLFIYYAGHTATFDEAGYLVPTGADIRHPEDLEFEAVSLRSLLRAVAPEDGAAGQGVVLLVDGARGAPAAWADNDLVPGLLAPNVPDGVLFGMAALPGVGSGNAPDAPSAFAKAVVAVLNGGETSLSGFAEAVAAEAAGAQPPFFDDRSAGRGHLGTPPAAARPSPQVAAAPPPAQDAALASQIEILFWESIKQSSDPADFAEYLARFPNGLFAGLASRRLNGLSNTASKAATAAAAPATQIAPATQTAQAAQVTTRTTSAAAPTSLEEAFGQPQTAAPAAPPAAPAAPIPAAAPAASGQAGAPTPLPGYPQPAPPLTQQQLAGLPVPAATATAPAMSAPATSAPATSALQPRAGLAPIPAQPAGYMRVARTNSNVRAGPGTTYGKVGRVRAGADVHVLGTIYDGSWSRIAFEGGEAFMATRLLITRDQWIAVRRQTPKRQPQQGVTAGDIVETTRNVRDTVYHLRRLFD